MVVVGCLPLLSWLSSSVSIVTRHQPRQTTNDRRAPNGTRRLIPVCQKTPPPKRAKRGRRGGRFQIGRNRLAPREQSTAESSRATTARHSLEWYGPDQPSPAGWGMRERKLVVKTVLVGEGRPVTVQSGSGPAGGKTIENNGQIWQRRRHFVSYQ